MKFLDVNGGIGGGRLGLERLGLKCEGFMSVDNNLSPLYDKIVQRKCTNFGADISDVNPDDLPDVELILARLSDGDGFLDSLCSIIEAKKPEVIFIGSNKLCCCEDDSQEPSIPEQLDGLGYVIYPQDLNVRDFGCVQCSEDRYFMGFRSDIIPEGVELGALKDGCEKESVRFFGFESPVSEGSHDAEYLKEYFDKPENSNLDMRSLLMENFMVLDARNPQGKIYHLEIPDFMEVNDNIYIVFEKNFYRVDAKDMLKCITIPDDKVSELLSSFSEDKILNCIKYTMPQDLTYFVMDQILDFLEFECEVDLF